MMGANRAIVQRVHAGAGGIFGMLLLVILISGAWSMVHEDLRTWFRGPAALASGTPLPVAHWLQVAREHGLSGEALHIRLPDGERTVVELCAAVNACTLALDPVGGRMLAPEPAVDILFNLHKSLFIGFAGRILVSLLGVVLIGLIVVGLALHSRRLGDLNRLRRDRGWRVLVYDLHSLIGVWALPWLLLFGITGAMSGLGALGTLTLADQAFPGAPRQAFMQLLGAPPQVSPQPALPQALDLDRLLRDDAAANPGFVVQSVTLHRWGEADAWLEVAGITPGLPSTAVFERRAYRGDDGQPLGDSSARGRGFWLRAFIAVQPLHFADYRWLPAAQSVLRAVHFAMALAAALLVLSGLYLWLERRRLKTGAGWQVLLRLTVGGGAGLLSATAVLLCVGALASLDLYPPGELSWWFWGSWLLSLLLALVSPSQRQPLGLLLGVAGLGWLAAGTLHLASSLVHASLAVWPVDLVLLLGGLITLWAAHRLRTSTRAAPTADAKPV